MNAIRIYGGKELNGQTAIQGSKNAALPILAATLMINGICEIENCPYISDVMHMLKLMECLGCVISADKRVLKIDATHLSECSLPAESVGKMRSSIMLLGAMLARCKQVEMQYPGGCVIGDRPIDLHLSGLKKMNVNIVEFDNGFYASTCKLVGAYHRLPFVSVGATENLILAGVCAEGYTVIEPAACEPEVCELCYFLCRAGAKIEGIGTHRISIRGVKKLYPVSFRISADRIVAGTYLAAGLCAGGEIFLKNAPVQQMTSTLYLAEKFGAVIGRQKDGIYFSSKVRPKNPALIKTGIYPGFPTDLQSPFLSVMSVAQGCGVMEETVFNNRFRVAGELAKMGADIMVTGKRAVVCGREKLYGTHVDACELRGGAALVVAALAAEGTVTVHHTFYIDRGYENIVADLQQIGAAIEYCNEAEG